MRLPVNEAQLQILRWVDDGAVGELTNGQKQSARALAHRRLLKVRGRGPTWRAELTDDGRFYLDHGAYPEEVAAEIAAPEPVPVQTPPEPKSRKARKPEPLPDWEVDSPRGKREARHRPRGDGLFSGDRNDPFDEKILISVKESAWLLSLPEGAIRDAVLVGDLDRVFIGEGRKNYRVVYGSLLAWVNDMPREPARRRWW